MERKKAENPTPFSMKSLWLRLYFTMRRSPHRRRIVRLSNIALKSQLFSYVYITYQFFIHTIHDNLFGKQPSPAHLSDFKSIQF